MNFISFLSQFLQIFIYNSSLLSLVIVVYIVYSCVYSPQKILLIVQISQGVASCYVAQFFSSPSFSIFLHSRIQEMCYFYSFLFYLLFQFVFQLSFLLCSPICFSFYSCLFLYHIYSFYSFLFSFLLAIQFTLLFFSSLLSGLFSCVALAVLHSVLELFSPAQVLLIEQNTATHCSVFFLPAFYFFFILEFKSLFLSVHSVLFCFLFCSLSCSSFSSFFILLSVPCSSSPSLFLFFLFSNLSFFFFKSAFLSCFFFYCFSFMFCYYSICSLSVILHPFRNTSLLSLLLLLLFSVNTFCCKDCMIFMFSHLSLSLLFSLYFAYYFVHCNYFSPVFFNFIEQIRFFISFLLFLCYSIKLNRGNALLFKMRKYVSIKILRSIYYAIFDSKL